MYPELFKIGSLSISSYGVLNALGYLAAVWYLIHNRGKIGISKETLWDMLFIAIVAAIIGGKLLDVALTWNELGSTFSEKLSNAVVHFRYGFTYLGGFIAVVASLIVFFRKKKLPLLKTSDFIIVALPLGHAIGRIGCFMVGCCYGKPWNGPWAVTFTNPQSSVEPALLGVPLHPAQLYEVLVNLIIFGVLHFAYNKKHKTGSILLLYLALYGAGRFIIEFFRADFRGDFVLGLSPSQVISAAMIVTAGTVYKFYIRKQNG